MPSQQKSKKVAVIGSGISGLGASWLLSEHSPHEITLYEQNDYVGGHTHTVDYVVPSTKNSSIPVDNGFIVYNNLTYPNLFKFFQHKNIQLMKTEMSFSVSRDNGDFEWSGRNLITVFSQLSNLWNIELWKILYDILRFNFHATELMELSEEHEERNMSTGEYLRIHQYSEAFKDNYLLPMTTAIWSTPPDKCTLDIPVLALIQFMYKQNLLQVKGCVDWFTVKGGSRKYVETITPHIKDIRLSTKVVSIKRRPDLSNTESPPIITVVDQSGRADEFDHVILAVHADQALRILGNDATNEEKLVLGGFRFSQNRSVLHSDLSSIGESTYGPVLVTLNPPSELDSRKIFDSQIYDHPKYCLDTISSQKFLSHIQNVPNLQTTFAGAWTGYGFHEDGFTSGIRVATEFLGAKCPFEVIDVTPIRVRKGELTILQEIQKKIWNGVEWTVNNSKPLAVIGITIINVYIQHAYKLVHNYRSISNHARDK
ncbi:58_t:CDS:2 [Diversispora eburnea]|uniref:58_t:CDS:1 n=1 Tax=Diversispora eburnea TaxID=1213867 RepID=A0A9N9ALR3_9GLOM|nr:58_t:CDS:2 [Diversispora eburnea]